MRNSKRTEPTTGAHHGDPELQLFERQMQRYSGGGDCAYERALSQLYLRLFEQRRRQLDALRSAGL